MSYYTEKRRATLDMNGQDLIDGDSVIPVGEIQDAIADIANDANGTAIATAVNGILAVLAEFGMIAEGE
jgi:hypothetical protein